ncbi:ferritin [Halalkalibacter urbisdiaboli]|uniref:ferritin n=1 Tax=Halalkalibacter urbisdiaboli TaxID=1960589 RepID=UPI000B438F33|nr:ferritin [Halalkalibacter urbisdiaboli]
MLPKEIVTALNNQMNYEFEAAHSYLAMASYFSAHGYHGFANFYMVQAEEERFHAMKFYHFLVSMGERPHFKALTAPNNMHESPLHIAKQSLEQEQAVTRSIYAIMDLATEHKEHATIQFLHWFVDEQVEEEELFRDIIQKLSGISVGGDYFMMMDKEFAERKMH